jgi:hypothetical protein
VKQTTALKFAEKCVSDRFQASKNKTKNDPEIAAEYKRIASGSDGVNARDRWSPIAVAIVFSPVRPGGSRSDFAILTPARYPQARLGEWKE